MQLTRFCVRSLHHRFVAWTTPDTTSLLLGTLTDLSRSKSQLVAANALLRRQVKQPGCTRMDRMLLVLLARAVQTWTQALFIVQEDDAPAVASSRFSSLLKVHIQRRFSSTESLKRDNGIDQRNGRAESTLGSGADPWCIAQVGHARVQAVPSEIHEAHAHTGAGRTELDHLPAQSRQGDVGLRLSSRD